MIGIKNIFKIHTALKEVFIRFPLPVLLVLAALVESLLLAHEVISLDKGFIPLFYLSIAINFVAQIVLKLIAESENWPFKKFLIVSSVVFIVIILYANHLIVSRHVEPFVFIAIALILGVMFAPYLRQQSTMNSFWYFNYQTGSAIFFAALASLILGGGLSLILVSIDYLFDIKVDKLLYADSWMLAGIGFAPMYILANIAKQFNYDDESCGFPKGIRFISNYLLVPLMMVYMLVLYAYFIKIILQWELPKGYLGWMIIAFGSIGVLTKLLTYPICDKANKLLSVFDRYFYKALIIPVLMLFFAIMTRINEYGITEQRYAVVMLGMWFLILITLSLLYKNKFHIKHVPMILAALAVISSYGPWSAGSLSLNSQMKRFESLLMKNNLLIGGQLKINKDSDSVTFKDRQSLYSTADYLSNRKWRKDEIRETLQSWNYDEIKFKKGFKKKITARQVLSKLNVEYAGRYNYGNNSGSERFHYSSHQSLNNTLINVEAYSFVTQSNFYNYKGEHRKKILTLQEGNRTEELTLNIIDNAFEVVRYDKDKILIDLNEFILFLRDKKIKKLSKKNQDKMIFEKTSKTGRFKAKLVLEKLSGSFTADNKILISNVKYLLMIEIADKRN